MSVTNQSNNNFFKRVYIEVKKIPEGKVATYGQIALLIGEPKRSKIVGWALHANPSEGVIPCHRVVNRLGELSESFVFGGINKQRILLEKEGIEFLNNGRIDLLVYQWKPSR